MHVVLCGSMHFIDTMKELSVELENLGHQVTLPIMTEEEIMQHSLTSADNISWDFSKLPDEQIAELKSKMLEYYFSKIRQGECILIVNEKKNGLINYVGPKAFLEMGVAFVLEKPIFMLNAIPYQENREELLGLQPIILENDLTKIML
ncbi:MAG: hypothetical protein OXR68_05135 [Alphaproteobacteria bacterium]|nr:hypothetical protein [Alphaproteobacteria bacterium]MDD9919987.1 hypothetical protein [Alphaproteobacteria bacterium]